jgi:hypothetical protein
MASRPLQRITAIAPRPGGVEMAHIVSSLEYILVSIVGIKVFIFGEGNLLKRLAAFLGIK